MVAPGDVDADLEGETKEECEKYGEVNKVVIFEVISTVQLAFNQTMTDFSFPDSKHNAR
jgi:hypothetical protein